MENKQLAQQITTYWVNKLSNSFAYKFALLKDYKEVGVKTLLIRDIYAKN